ncbi:MAG: ABC transporter ATP-binding protein [Ktedonobacteraceae bacterium]|nr:ABC transporter ATP-binding protein [Ktedonobacteraceae bacterium]
MPLKRYRDLLLTYLKPQWRQGLLLSILLCGGLALSLINPQLMRWFIDSASTGQQLQALLGVALLYLGVAFLSQFVSVVETYVAENMALIATNRLRTDLMLHVLQLDSAFHTAHTPGELIERVDGDVGKLSNFFSRFILSLLGNVLLLSGVLFMLFRVDWRVGLVMSCFVLFALLVMNRVRNLASPYWEAERQASAELFGFLEERLSGTEDIRASGANAFMLRGLHERSRTVLRTLVRAVQINSASWVSMSIIFVIGTAAALALGALLFQAGQISIGTVYLIFAYTNLLNNPIEQIVQQVRDMQQASGSIKRILDLLVIQGTIEDGRGEALPPGPLAVSFDDVTFCYHPELPVLKHISLTLEPGTVLGLLGRTGSGKTTMTRLLARLYDPTQGALRLGDIDLRELSLDDLRSRLGMVTQDVHVLHTTVRHNLTFFDGSISDERIIEVLEELGLGPWFHALPEGLSTKLAPGGTGLSAGEAQLFAFARIFLKNPGLVILDEASSRLDPATERRLEQAIQRLMKDRTGIIIAHRLATVLRADMIMILEDGQTVEYGPREQLAADPHSRFSELLRTGLEEALI